MCVWPLGDSKIPLGLLVLTTLAHTVHTYVINAIVPLHIKGNKKTHTINSQRQAGQSAWELGRYWSENDQYIVACQGGGVSSKTHRRGADNAQQSSG